MKKILKNLDAYFAGFMFAITLVVVVVNVFTRYFANYIIPWGEEVATTCFVYTTFVGAAWCLRTHQHVGVDLLVDKLPAGARKIVHIITDLIILVTNGYITWLSYQFVSSSQRENHADPEDLLRLAELRPDPGLRPHDNLLADEPGQDHPRACRYQERGGERGMTGFIIYLPIIIALALYFTGIPIAYALMTATLTFFTFIDTTSRPYLLMQKFITSTQSFPFLAIPFFVMAGSLMNYSGMSEKLMAFADALTGHMKGGLAQINVLLSMLMGGCSGSANADAAMECKMLVPEMEKRGYGKGFSAAITAASSCITPIIPPGINLIVYGLIAGASVG